MRACIQRKQMSSFAYFMIKSGNEAVDSFYPVGDPGRIFSSGSRFLSHFKNWSEKMLTPFVHGNIKTIQRLLKTFKATLIYSDALYFSTMTKSLDAFSGLSIVEGSCGDQGRLSDGEQSHPCLLCLQPRRRTKFIYCGKI